MTDRMGERGRQGAAPLGGHTPGPWAYQHGSVYSFISAPTIDDPYFARTSGQQREENARLIAAAPELLAALEATLPVLRGIGRGYSWADGEYTADEAVAVIAKARGEQ